MSDEDIQQLIKIAYKIGYGDKCDNLPCWTNISYALKQTDKSKWPIILDDGMD